MCRGLRFKEQVGQRHFVKFRKSGANHEEQQPGLAGLDATLASGVPSSFLATLKAAFFASAWTGLETAPLVGCPHRGMGARHRL